MNYFINWLLMHLVINKQLRTFEIAGSNAHIILLTRMVELGKTPINETELTFLVVNHYIVRFDISKTRLCLYD